MANAHETPSPVDEHHGVGHVVPFKILLAVFGSLVVLTIITYLASLVNFGEFNLVVALAIAVIKASLVVLFFMHLRWDRPFNAIVFVGCIIFVAIFLGFTLIDTTQYHHMVYTDQAPGMKNHVPMKAERLSQ
ncbi:MAG: cytochrome C oxidase subunit IV family protein [Phycisphaerae bacterium]